MSVKFAQQGGPISDKIEGLSYNGKSIENDEYYHDHHISKNKKKCYRQNNFYGGSKLEIWVKKSVFFFSCTIANDEKKNSDSAQRSINPIIFCLAVFGWPNTRICNSFFFAQRRHIHFKGSKNA